MKTTVLFILSLLFIGKSYSQEAAFDWARSMGSSNLEKVRDITTDAAGNSYIVGAYTFTIDFDPGPGIAEFTPLGSTDIYIIKFNNTGEFDWCKSIGGSNFDVGNAIHSDSSGDILITGYFTGTVDFNPSADVYELTSSGSGDCYVLKLDAEGNFIWAKSFGDGLLDSGYDLTTDDVGNIYTSGIYKGTVDFDPGPAFFDITSEGEEDVFIQKLDSEGNFIWAKSIGGEDEEGIESICLDSDNNVFIGGNFEGTSDFNPDIGVVSFTAVGFFDDYIIKLNSDGNFEWALTVGGILGDELIGLAVDSEDNLYSTGYFNSTIDIDPSAGITEFSPSGTDFFVQKLDTDGNLLWAKQTGGADQEIVYGLDLDESNNIYTTGYFIETTDFNPNAGIYNITSEGSSDCFIQKLDQDGNFIWAKSLGGSNLDEGDAIDINSEGNIYLTGSFQSTVDFNPGDGEYNLESNGDYDIFVLKLNACSPDAVTDEITACISYTWTNGVTYFEDNNSATQNLLNIDGCDSVVNLDLTITEVDITTTAVGGVITSNAAGTGYQWLDCNDGYSEIDGETSASYTPTEDGDYAVNVIIDDCSDTSECVVIDGVGIDESPISILSIYPNPSNGFFDIDLGDLHVLSIRIYAVNGDLVYAAQNLSTGLHTFEIDVDAGVYFVEVLTEADRGQFKLVIE